MVEIWERRQQAAFKLKIISGKLEELMCKLDRATQDNIDTVCLEIDDVLDCYRREIAEYRAPGASEMIKTIREING